MQNTSSEEARGSLFGLIDAAYDLGCSYDVYRHGLRFEHSGDSMAVFDGVHRVDRVPLPSASDYEFQHAIDLWLFNRYCAEVA